MTELDKSIKVFKEIEATGGKNDKIAIIKNNGDNHLFVDMLDFLYNEYIRTGLAESKINKVINAEREVTIDNVWDMMEFLKANNTGSDKVIATVQHYLNLIDDKDNREFLIKLFTKTYKCGITVKSVNKALGANTIPDFACQLAHPYEKYAEKLNKEFAITQKLDGHRTLAFCENGSVTFRTRKGHVIDGLVDVEAAVLAFSMATGKTDFVLDGEMMMINTDNLPTDELFKATGKILRSKGSKTGVEFHVFDYLSIAEFQKGESLYPYSARREAMDKLFTAINSPLLIKVDVLYQGSDKQEITNWSQKATSNGWEGVMVNVCDGKYLGKRTAGLLKVKAFYSSDVQVIDVYEGKAGTQNEGLLGGVIIQFKDFTVNVGSGFSELERHEYWNDPSKIIGKIIEVQYFEETSNDKGGKSLRFPTFKGVRHDKTVDDISYES